MQQAYREKGEIQRSRIGMTVALKTEMNVLRVGGTCDTYSKFEAQSQMTNRLSFGICRSSYRHTNSYGAKFHLFQDIKIRQFILENRKKQQPHDTTAVYKWCY